MIKIEILIDDTKVAHFGGIVIGEFVHNRITGEVIGVDKIGVPGFIFSAAAEKGKHIIYAKVKKSRKK